MVQPVKGSPFLSLVAPISDAHQENTKLIRAFMTQINVTPSPLTVRK